MRNAVLPLLLVALSGCTAAAPPTTGTVDQFTLESQIVGDTYLILTRTPPNYDPAKTYPVVYQLDATNFGEFDLTAGWTSELESSGTIPPTIVVGIGYPYSNSQPDGRGRWRDYVAKDINQKPTMGAANFLRFIKEELFPAIDGKLSTGMRIISGHSLGGFFALYALLNSGTDAQPPFQGFIANDGTLGTGELVDYDTTLAAATSSLPRVVWMDYARYDGAPQELWFNVIQARLQQHYADLRLTTREYQTDHAGVMSPGYRDGLAAVLGGAQ